MRGISRLAENLLASEEGLCSMEQVRKEGELVYHLYHSCSNLLSNSVRIQQTAMV
jgi:hypothetical protein